MPAVLRMTRCRTSSKEAVPTASELKVRMFDAVASTNSSLLRSSRALRGTPVATTPGASIAVTAVRPPATSTAANIASADGDTATASRRGGGNEPAIGGGVGASGCVAMVVLPGRQRL